MTPHKCPVCGGTGWRKSPPWTEDSSGTSAAKCSCHGCGGTGLVWEPAAVFPACTGWPSARAEAPPPALTPEQRVTACWEQIRALLSKYRVGLRAFTPRGNHLLHLWANAGEDHYEIHPSPVRPKEES